MADPRVVELGVVAEERPPQPRFFFDLSSPEAWLVAERVLTELPELAEWVPVEWLGAQEYDWDAVAARAGALGLPPVRRPTRPVESSRTAMLAATYARTGGKTVAFCQAVLRQVFVGGRALEDVDTLLLAGAAAEIHPRALLKALETKSTARALDAATEGARAAGVTRAPALATLGGEVYAGVDCIALASASTVLDRG